MKKTIHKFDIQRLEVLKPNGSVDSKLMPKLSTKQIKEMYAWMIRTRDSDTKALKLQRTGRMGTYGSQLGQEATIIGSTYAMRKEDYLFPSFRINGGMMLRGVPMHQLYQYWGGDERGMKFPRKSNVFPLCITVGEQQLHGTGFAWGLKIQKKRGVVLSDFGDGGTSEGDFHEALNFAGVFKAPIVFLCQNNQWAISNPVSKQTASKTLAQKAIAYGIKGIQVDGNDLFAMYKATQEAIKDAQKGMPTLIEAETYRIEHHTTSDDWTKYRSKKEVAEWQKKDPIDRVYKYMIKKKIWSKAKDDKLRKEISAEVDKAVKKYLAITPPNREEMFNYMFAKGGK